MANSLPTIDMQLREGLKPLVKEAFAPKEDRLEIDHPDHPVAKIQELSLTRLEELGIDVIISTLQSVIKDEAPEEASDLHKKILASNLRAHLELTLEGR